MKDDDSNKGSNNSLDSTQEKNNAKMRLSINDVHTDVDRVSFTSSPLLVDNRRRSAMWEGQGEDGFLLFISFVHPFFHSICFRYSVI